MTDSRLSFDFSGKVVIVTGGTKGIGRSIAEAFLVAGAQVAVCGRSTPEDLPHAGGRTADFLTCDVRDAQSVQQFIDAVVRLRGRIDVLVNNAGGSPEVPAATMSPRLFEKVVQLNLLAPFYCSQAVNRVMQQQADGGSIINIASVAATRPSPGTSAYGAAKTGLLQLSETLAMEWGPKVRVNGIIAGLTATENALDHYGGEEGIARIDAMLPAQRMGTPQDIAQACLYLASPLAAYVSGARLAVHGGGERPLFQYLAQMTHK